MNLEELRRLLAAAQDEARAVDAEAGDNVFTPEQQTRFDAALAEKQRLEGLITAEEARREERSRLAAAGQDDARRGGARLENGDGAANAPAVHIRHDPFAILEDRSVTGRARTTALRDSILRTNEDLIEDPQHQENFERLLKRHSRQTWWAENLLGRSRDEYTEGFEKLMTGRSELLTAEERAAIAVGTASQGGYLVPTFLDPTLMITSAGSANVMRQHATVKTLVSGKTWTGVTTAGVTASWDNELTEVSDDSPTFDDESIPVHKPQAWIEASVEAFEDIVGLAGDVLALLADARDTLEGAAHMTGSGNAPVPAGLFTLLAASSTLRITSTTAATIGEVDLAAVVEALPQRFRNQVRSKWVMNPKYGHAVKRLGTSVSSTFSGDLTQPASERILGYGAVYTDDAPVAQTTTALDQEIAFADLTKYTIVDKPGGTSIEFVPVTFGSNGRPNGKRGWYAHWRTGAGMPVLNAGRILVDKTSA